MFRDDDNASSQKPYLVALAPKQSILQFVLVVNAVVTRTGDQDSPIHSQHYVVVHVERADEVDAAHVIFIFLESARDESSVAARHYRATRRQS
jgi:hypothetical protein